MGKLTSSTTAELRVKQKLADVLYKNVGLKILSAIISLDMYKIHSFEPFKDGPTDQSFKLHANMRQLYPLMLKGVLACINHC